MVEVEYLRQSIRKIGTKFLVIKMNNFRQMSDEDLAIIDYLQRMKTLPCGTGSRIDEHIVAIIHRIYQND